MVHVGLSMMALTTRNALTVDHAATGLNVSPSYSWRSPRSTKRALRFLISPSGVLLYRNTRCKGTILVVAFDFRSSSQVSCDFNAAISLSAACKKRFESGAAVAWSQLNRSGSFLVLLAANALDQNATNGSSSSVFGEVSAWTNSLSCMSLVA